MTSSLPTVCRLALVAMAGVILPLHTMQGADNADPVLGLMLEKGMITQEEAAKVQSQVDALHTNPAAQFPASQWKISSGFKDLEIYGDARLRYEGRTATDPKGGSIDLNRLRYAVRLGLRGELYDDFYYGLRVETGANPRSPFVTAGTSSTTTPVPYQGPFGKSNSGISIGQVYFGWHPEDWFDVTLGKMPNPLYSSSMVWSPTINPEGIAEHLKYTVGEADFFANFSQFLYQDTNPTKTSDGYFNPLTTYSSTLPFMLAWQAGVNFHITKKISFKVGPTLYNYTSFLNGVPPGQDNVSAPGFYGTYVGQGTPTGVNSVAAAYNLAPNGGGFDGFAANQTGINDLLVLEIPFELNIKLDQHDLRFFGDYAQNLHGAQRAQAAYEAANSSYFSASGAGYAINTISSPQTHDVTAYQIGAAYGSQDSLGLVNGATAKRHAWEIRSYWQHVEQYSLDPNLIDLDFMEGVENLQGVYVAAAYGITDNLIGTFRYGHASRINSKLGTGGSGQDIPQMNPINDYDLFQVDLTLKF